MPHAMIMMVSRMNGDQALRICPLVYLFSTAMVGSTSFSNRQMVLGFQNLRKIMRLMMEPTPAITSGNAGPRKFEVNHCRSPKLRPHTRIAGNTSFAFFTPAIMMTR